MLTGKTKALLEMLADDARGRALIIVGDGDPERFADVRAAIERLQGDLHAVLVAWIEPPAFAHTDRSSLLNRLAIACERPSPSPRPIFPCREQVDGCRYIDEASPPPFDELFATVNARPQLPEPLVTLEPAPDLPRWRTLGRREPPMPPDVRRRLERRRRGGRR